MKSSTIRRSTLSRETMEVIENLAKEQEANGLPNEYLRPDEHEEKSSNDTLSSKAQEIDLLWQNFKSSQFNSNSPAAYIAIGFLSGVVVTIAVLLCVGAFVSKSNIKLSQKPFAALEKMNLLSNEKAIEQTLEQQADNAQDSVDKKVSVPSEDETVAVNTQPVANEVQSLDSASSNSVDMNNSKKYVVKSGDTAESIIKHYYGSWSQEKADLLMKANNLSNLDRINIGQELIIPMAK